MEDISTFDKAELSADVLVFLVSDLSRGINGAILPIDKAFSCI
jgi:enoyl-[acyl-carrier-protein] reductase (NADH)